MSKSLSAQLRQAFAGATPGPWRVAGVEKLDVITDGPSDRCGRPGQIGKPTHPEDAPLLAAAPELLELLAEAVQMMETGESEGQDAFDAFCARVRELVEREQGK